MLYALKLGTVGFGGPVALVGYMYRDLVEQRHWISEADYKEGLALAQLMPGPLAAQLAMYLGYVHYRNIGATLVGIAREIPAQTALNGRRPPRSAQLAPCHFNPLQRTRCSISANRVVIFPKLGDLIAQIERRVTRALRMVLVRNGCTEQRHDAIASVLIDRAFEAMHAFVQNLKETIEDLMPLLGIELSGQLHRAFDIRKQYCHLLALAFERGLRLQDFVGEVFGGVVSNATGRKLGIRASYAPMFLLYL